MDKIYDLIIIGAGPAGLVASIYASRYRLDHLIFGAQQGGQMSEIADIENWPGDVIVVGRDLISRFVAHAESYGIKVKNESVILIKKADGFFEVETSRGKYQAKSLILAMGAEYRKMNIPGEKEYIGKGVSYCATCDAPFFRDKTVAVIGGGNSAAVVAIEMSDYAQKTYLINKGEKMNAEPIWLEKIHSSPNIEIIKNTGVIEIRGNEKVEKIILDKEYDSRGEIAVGGVFIEVGSEPGVQLAKKLGMETDDGNYIKVNSDMSTSVSGVFAAGDITTGSNKFRQILTAAAEGAIAANSAYKMLKLK
ncbi:MAG: Pyr redox 2 protein [Patescibacteria group bacterium]|nr:Pyr redox 2 protein [Patescibacteria group bacterium]